LALATTGLLVVAAWLLVVSITRRTVAVVSTLASATVTASVAAVVATTAALRALVVATGVGGALVGVIVVGSLLPRRSGLLVVAVTVFPWGTGLTRLLVALLVRILVGGVLVAGWAGLASALLPILVVFTTRFFVVFTTRLSWLSRLSRLFLALLRLRGLRAGLATFGLGGISGFTVATSAVLLLVVVVFGRCVSLCLFDLLATLLWLLGARTLSTPVSPSALLVGLAAATSLLVFTFRSVVSLRVGLDLRLRDWWLVTDVLRVKRLLRKLNFKHGHNPCELEVIKALFERFVLVEDCDVRDLVDLVQARNPVLNKLSQLHS
jgi:hypothetical protein